MALKLAAFEGVPAPGPRTGPTPRSWCATASSTRQAILERFVAEGRTVERIETGAQRGAVETSIAQTLDAMRRGVEVIHQAACRRRRRWLRRLPGARGAPSTLATGATRCLTRSWRASPRRTSWCSCRPMPACSIDCRATRPSSWQSAGNGERDHTGPRISPLRAGASPPRSSRRSRKASSDTYPLPCGHCGICGYRRACEQRRIADDHLTLVAGMRRDQVARLEAAGDPTRRRWPELPEARRAADAARHSRSCAARRRCSSHERPPASRSTSSCPSRTARVRPAARSRRRRPLLRHRGRPVLGGERARVPVRVGWLRRRQRGFRPFWAHDRQEERARSRR